MIWNKFIRKPPQRPLQKNPEQQRAVSQQMVAASQEAYKKAKWAHKGDIRSGSSPYGSAEKMIDARAIHMQNIIQSPRRREIGLGRRPGRRIR